MTETYWKGDRAEYTGKTETHINAIWYELRLLEGHRKGETVLTGQPPEESSR